MRRNPIESLLYPSEHTAESTLYRAYFQGYDITTGRVADNAISTAGYFSEGVRFVRELWIKEGIITKGLRQKYNGSTYYVFTQKAEDYRIFFEI